MKSIFKKIAFVLALAMVVTMMPAKAAAAASNDGPQFYPTLKLYIGGDVTGSYEGQRYAKVWNKGDYEVSFESEDPSIAKVNSKGYVTAVGVGSTTITATFTAEGEDDVVKTCAVTVKKNAAKVGLGSESAKTVAEGIPAGEVVQLTALRKDEEGHTEWNKSMKNYSTDSVRFSSSNPEVFTVTKTTGKLTAVKEGEATLKVWTVQSEGFDEEAQEYPEVVSKEYTVKVVSTEINVAQSAYNAFVMNFPNPEEAKAALTETKKSLTDANAAVSEAEEIVKVYKVLADSNNARREVFIGDLAYKDGAEGVTTSIEVTMFNELDEKSTYVVCYKDQEKTFETPEYVADRLEMFGQPIETYADYSVQEVRAMLYTGNILIGRSWADSCRKYQNWQNSLAVEDTNTSLVHNEYQFDAGNGGTPKVWFYTTDRNFKVNLKGNFEDWAHVNSNGQAKVIPAVTTLSPNDSSIRVNNFNAWCVVQGQKQDWQADWNNKTIASEDEGFYLLVKANITEMGSTGDKVSSKYTAEDGFTFVSSNDDKLAVNKETGELYPPKNAANGTVGIHVYYKNVYVGTCNVQIYAKRSFASLTANASLSKMSYSATNPEINEAIVFTLYPKDQLNANFNTSKHGSMDYVVKVSDSLKQYFDVNANGEATYLGESWDGYPQYKLEVKPGAQLPKNIVNVRVQCIATYHPYDGSREIVRQYPVSFSLKDTTKSTATTYRLSTSTQSVDMKIETKKDQSNNEINNVSEKNVVISAFGYDRDGYKVEKLDLNGDYNVSVKFGSKSVDASNLEASGKDVIFKPVITTIKKFATVSGSGVELETVTRSAIEKLDEGSYVVALYKGTSNTSLHSMLVSLKDTQERPTMTWKKDTSEEALEILAIRDVVKVKYGSNDNVSIYVGYQKNPGDTNATVSDDYTLTGPNGQNIYIAKVRYAVQFADDWYEFEIPVKRTVVFGTNNN